MIRIGFLVLALSVILGAFGAHSLENYLQPEQLKVWNTAVQYQVYHALGILILALFSDKAFIKKERIRYAQIFLLIGIVLFSGSLYFLSTKSMMSINLSWLGPVTPLGGVCFIAGWILAVFSIQGSGKESKKTDAQ